MSTPIRVLIADDQRVVQGVNAWAGTFETFRRPIVENGTGASKARNIGFRKLRLTFK